MKEFSGIEKGIIVLLFGVWYFILVAWAHNLLSLLSEGLANIVVFFAILVCINYVFFDK